MNINLGTVWVIYLKHKFHDIQILKGDVVLIKRNEKNGGKWE